jgi:hypothetical protein
MEKLNNVTQEQWFDFWVQEAIKEGFIIDYVPEKDIPPFELFDGLSFDYTEDKILNPGTHKERKKRVFKKEILLYPMSYRPDGVIIWNPKVKDILFNDLFEKGDAYFKAQFTSDLWVTILDVKAPTGVNRAADLPFSFTRKFMWEKLKLYVNKVMIIPPGTGHKGYLFRDVWTPARYFMTDKLTKERSINFKAINVEQFKAKHNL